jgi:APA family basic amino acid/polyamine antiporter
MPLAADDALGGIVASRTVVDIARIGFGFLLIVSMVPVAACLSLSSRFPEQYAAAPFRLKSYVLYPCIVFALAGITYQVLFLLSGLPTNLLIAQGVIVGMAIAYVVLRWRRPNVRREGEGDAPDGLTSFKTTATS